MCAWWAADVRLVGSGFALDGQWMCAWWAVNVRLVGSGCALGGQWMCAVKAPFHSDASKYRCRQPALHATCPSQLAAALSLRCKWCSVATVALLRLQLQLQPCPQSLPTVLELYAGFNNCFKQLILTTVFNNCLKQAACPVASGERVI